VSLAALEVVNSRGGGDAPLVSWYNIHSFKFSQQPSLSSSQPVVASLPHMRSRSDKAVLVPTYVSKYVEGERSFVEGAMMSGGEDHGASTAPRAPPPLRQEGESSDESTALSSQTSTLTRSNNGQSECYSHTSSILYVIWS